MDIRSWTGTEVLLTSVVYWLLLLAGWWIYVTRPSVQAKTRDRALRRVERDPTTGEVTMLFEHSTNLLRVVLVVLGPPVLFASAWLLMERG